MRKRKLAENEKQRMDIVEFKNADVGFLVEQMAIAAERALDEKLADFAVVFNIDRKTKMIGMGLLRNAKQNILDTAEIELLPKGQPDFLR